MHSVTQYPTDSSQTVKLGELLSKVCLASLDDYW